MTITELGSLGEFLSTFVVLASLMYLAVQVRAAKRSLTVSVQMQIGQAVQQPSRDLYSNPELVGLWQRGVSDYENLSREEKGTFGLIVKAYFAPWASAFYAAEHDESILSRVQPAIDDMVSLKGVQEYWKEGRRSSSEQWRRYLDQRIEIVNAELMRQET